MPNEVPSWAMAHLEKHMPAGNPIVNAQVVRRNLVLANTRLGAVLVRRTAWSGIRHTFLEVPSQKTAFRCAKCRENLQFYNLDIPADVYCSICAARYHVNEVGLVADAAGTAVPAEFKPRELQPFPPVWDLASRVRDKPAPARAPAIAAAPLARRAPSRRKATRAKGKQAGPARLRRAAAARRR